MIQALFRLAAFGERQQFRQFLLLAISTGIVRGIAVILLLPLMQHLLQREYQAFLYWLLAMMIAAGISAYLEAVATMRGFDEAMKLIHLMHKQLGRHLIRLPIGWFAPEKSAFAAHIAVRGTLLVAQSAMDILLPLIINICVPLSVAVIMLFIDWRLGLILILSTPLIYALTHYSTLRHERAEQNIHHAHQQSGEAILEYIQCQSLLRSSHYHSGDYPPLIQALNAQHQAQHKALFASLWGMLSQSILVQTLLAIVVSSALLFALNGSLTPAKTLALIGLCALFSGPLKLLSEYGAGLKRAKAVLLDIVNLLNTPSLPEAENPEPAPNRHDITLSNVSFGYHSHAPILQGLNLHIPNGQITALVGASGCGKSTIIQLIARFWDIDSGSISIGGHDIRQLSHQELMQQFSLVFQQVYLFDDSLEANIRLGNPHASEADLHTAITLSGVDEIIARLPEGLNSRVGEGGSALSGGERQRVSIARALLKRAPIVLFDEATAALDGKSAQIVSAAIEELAKNATVVVIAHQLNTILSAHQIAFIAQGKVCECGDHHSLVAQNGRYAQFWQAHLSPNAQVQHNQKERP